MAKTQNTTQVFINALFLFSCLALTGHVIINFWEQWMIQNEITNMKRSLFSLTEMVLNIKKSYDNFEAEVSAIIKIVDYKQGKEFVTHTTHLKQAEYQHIV